MKCKTEPMVYSWEGFYKPYEEYLQTDGVIEEHYRIFSLFSNVVGKGMQVADLGCATCEFGKWLERSSSFKSYTGIDLNEACQTGRWPTNVLIGDYRDKAFDGLYSECNVFVSIFSTECHLSADEKYALYERMFSFPHMEFGLVAGFVYDSRPNDEKIQERIGFDVFQTIESPWDYRSEMFDEFRHLTRVPPGMFGDPFTEVWKIMVRR